MYSYELSEEEKMDLERMDRSYEILDSLKIIRAKDGGWSGHDITDLLSGVYEDYITFERLRKNPALVVYYRDLLSYLIKTYGH